MSGDGEFDPPLSDSRVEGMVVATDTNPFLLLGVSSDAEMSAIQSVGKRRLMALRLEDDSDPKLVTAIERALEQLADPVTRFEAGLFALELTDAEAATFRADPVLSTIAMNPGQDGVTAYELICEADNPTTLAHNRGSLRFMQAVAATREAQQGTPDDISDDLACVQLWKDAYKSLRLAFGSDKFWLRQKLRAKSYEDKRLSPERVEEIRAGIYGRVVDPVGQVITRALLDRHAKVAKAYVDLLRDSDFGREFFEEVLSRVYQPIADRVEQGLASIEQSLESAEKSISSFDRAFSEFESRIAPDLEVMLEVGDLPGYAEEHARDTAATFLRSLAIDVANEVNEYDLSRRILDAAVRFVDSKALAARLKGDQATLDEVATQAATFQGAKACAFCGEPKAEHASEVKMHRVTSRSFGKVQYQTAEVKVPRCSKCMKVHEKLASLGCAGGLLVFVAILVSTWISSGSLVTGSVAAAILSLIILGLGVSVLDSFRNLKIQKHPVIRHFQSEGFVFGEKPSR